VLFRVLGPLEARAADGTPVRLGAQKHRVLLGVLLLTANRWVSVDSLVDAVWPGHPPRSATAILRTYVSALRKALRLDVDAFGGGYRLRVAPDELDLTVFEELAGKGHKAKADGDIAMALAAYQEALALWRGRLLEDVPLDAEYAAEAARLEELRLNVLEALTECRLVRGQHAEVLAEVAPWIVEQPLRERLHGHWMVALYRCGRQADALQAYLTLRDRLVDQLGVEPSPPIQRLHRLILNADPELDPPPAVPARPVATPRQLPPDVGSFTGRASDLARLRRLLTEPQERGPVPVLAIDGIGGIGKSALAVRAAHEIADRFPDGQLYANLGTPPQTPLTVLNRFLRALGPRSDDVVSLDEAAAEFRALTTGKQLLVLLDNASDAAQVQPLIPASATCRVLVTSRQVLATLDNAVHLHLDLLPPAEAAALLGRLAGSERVEADRAAAAEAARLCGYLPLALRIAGARLAARPTWRLRTLVDRLADAGRRLDELQLGDLGVRACFQLSLRGLAESPDEADRAAGEAFPLLASLNWADLSADAAAPLLGWPRWRAEAALERLVDAQLLDSRVPGRYRVHDLLRLYGQEVAADRYSPGARTAALWRIVRWYADRAVASARLTRPGDAHPALAASEMSEVAAFADVREALDWLEAEHPNIVAAIAQAGADPAAPAGVLTRLVQALYGFFLTRGHWHDWIEANRTALAVARRRSDVVGQAYAERDLGIVHERLGAYERALAHLHTALAMFRTTADQYGAASCLNSIGVTYSRQGRYAEAVDFHRQGLAIRRASGDRTGQATTLNNLGIAYLRLGDYANARACYEEGLAIAAELEDRWVEAAILTNLGAAHEGHERYAEAVACHQRSLAICRDLQDRDGQAACLNNLGRVQRLLGRCGEAIGCQEEGLAIARALGSSLTEAECLHELGIAQRAVGRHPQARANLLRAHAMFTELGVPDAAAVKALLDQAELAEVSEPSESA
jgi:DNA-binding SARP family transcriptional activator